MINSNELRHQSIEGEGTKGWVIRGNVSKINYESTIKLMMGEFELITARQQ